MTDNKAILALTLIIALLSSTTGCSNIADRINNIGEKPELSKISLYEQNPPSESLVPMNVPKEHLSDIKLYDTGKKEKKYNNSIWNAQYFLSPRKVGDIISVIVSVKDHAKLDNQTQKNRTGKTSLGTPRLFGLDKKINRAIPRQGEDSAASLLSINNSNNSTGSGKINRSETIDTTLAVTVTSILPSGNMIIKGSQEIRVNYEAREITLAGIVNPMDIDNQGSIKLEKVAEARISYGGRGHISQYQQDQYGKQLIDIISPF